MGWLQRTLEIITLALPVCPALSARILQVVNSRMTNTLLRHCLPPIPVNTGTHQGQRSASNVNTGTSRSVLIYYPRSGSCAQDVSGSFVLRVTLKFSKFGPATAIRTLILPAWSTDLGVSLRWQPPRQLPSVQIILARLENDVVTPTGRIVPRPSAVGDAKLECRRVYRHGLPPIMRR